MYRPAIIILTLLTVGCGSSAPTAPTPGSGSSTNHAPEISIARVTPSAIGYVWRTTYTAHAEAQDSDGGVLTYTWTSSNGSAVSGTRSSDGRDISFVVTLDRNQPPLTLSVTDPEGATATRKLDFQVRLVRDKFSGHIGGTDGYEVFLSQTESGADGWISDPRSHDPSTGTPDPAQPPMFDGAGDFSIRFKFSRGLGDLTLSGQVTSDFRLVGTATGSGFMGQPFELVRDLSPLR